MAAHRTLTRRRASNHSRITVLAAIWGSGALFGCRSATTAEPVGETSPLEGVPASPPGASGVRFGPPPPDLMPPGVPGFDPEEWGEAEPPILPDDDALEPEDPQGSEIDPELAPRDPFAPPSPDAPLAPPTPEGIDL